VKVRKVFVRQQRLPREECASGDVLMLIMAKALAHAESKQERENHHGYD
jgi:hypothetical protein